MRRIAMCVLLACGLAGSARGEPPTTHEILTERPSGFWTSNRPAVGGAYRYRLLGIGLAVLLAAGWMTWRIVARASRAR